MVTFNGQNQGELGSAIFKVASASHLAISSSTSDTTRVDSRVRRELFSTNREGLKDGPVKAGLIQHVQKMPEDETLKAIESELTENFAKREAQSTSEEVKRQVVKLLQEAGLQVQKEGPAAEADRRHRRPGKAVRRSRGEGGPGSSIPFRLCRTRTSLSSLS